MTVSAWIPLLLAVPVLLLGEWLVRRITFLGHFNIPAPVVSGLLLSLGVLTCSLVGFGTMTFATKVTAQWWTWLVTIETEWVNAPSKSVILPLIVGFFSCIGLNATWDLLRRGSVQVMIFFGIATVLAVIQNAVGILLAKMFGVNPLLGLICGSVTLTGGHGTSIGLAPQLEAAGLSGAAVLGAAAATLGLVAGGLIGGPVGNWLVRRHHLQSPCQHSDAKIADTISVDPKVGIIHDFLNLTENKLSSLQHILLLLVCIKAGAWLSHFIEMTGLALPPQIGAMILGIVIRNTCDLSGWRWINTDKINVVGSLLLGLFLAVAMMSLNLIELAEAALPMLAILSVQIVIMALFAIFITFRVMGSDYDAAIMAGGHCGFGLGATPNAIANMKCLVDRFGSSPRAFLIVPVVGAMFIDFSNLLNITLFINLLQ